MESSPRWIPPLWFYDSLGSELFHKITNLPEYYQTRTERQILVDNATEIAATSGATTLVELGSGNSSKTRVLLDAFTNAGHLKTYVPFDIEVTVLEDAARSIASEYPDLEIRPVAGVFERHLSYIETDGHPALALFLGGTVGNLDVDQRTKFLEETSGFLKPGDWFLVGTDLVKDERTLLAAYDDSAFITRAFNLNMLTNLNRELHANFDVEGFVHAPKWCPPTVEMRLEAVRDMTVTVEDLEMEFQIAKGEWIRTEQCFKFTRDQVADELHAAGFRDHRFFSDPSDGYLLTLAQR